MKSRDATIAFDALSHSIRVKIFRKLVARGKSGIGASELCELMDIPPATLSFPMSKLVNGDLVDLRKKGKYVTYTANHKQVSKLIDFLMEKCCTEDASSSMKFKSGDGSSAPFGCSKNVV